MSFLPRQLCISFLELLCPRLYLSECITEVLYSLIIYSLRTSIAPLPLSPWTIVFLWKVNFWVSSAPTIISSQFSALHISSFKLVGLLPIFQLLLVFSTLPFLPFLQYISFPQVFNSARPSPAFSKSSHKQLHTHLPQGFQPSLLIPLCSFHAPAPAT